MAHFTFPLDGVLRVREHVLEQRQRELAEVASELAALQAQLQELDQAMGNITADVRDNRLTGRLDVEFLAAHRRYSLAMQRKAMSLAQLIAAVQIRWEAARLAVVETSRDKKIMEKLRERRLAEWTANQARRETADLDEIGTRSGHSAADIDGEDAARLHAAPPFPDEPSRGATP